MSIILRANRLSVLKSGLIAATLLSAGHSAVAQQPPDAGQQIRQIPPPPQPERPAPGIRIERSDAPASAEADATKIRVNSLSVTGQTLFPEADLLAATGFTPGDYSLGELRGFASKVTAYYNSRGYPLAQAYLPAQDVNDGRVTVAMAESRYGKIELRNRSSLRDGVAHRVLEGLDSGDPVAIAPLERRLLLLSDIPGIAVNSTLAPGTEGGTSDLIVNIDPARRVTGVIEADNAGNRYTGAYRGGGTVNFNNLTGHGDVASLRLLGSTAGLLYGRASYQTLVGLATVGAAYAHIDYELGKEFKSLDASGTADIATLYAAYPLVRSRDDNLRALVSADARWFTDKVGLTATRTERMIRSLTAGVDGDHYDDLGGGAWTAYSVAATYGDLDIETPADRAADAAGLRTNGSYGKLQLAASRLQTIAGPFSLYGAVRGQLASKNLDSSEKMQLGGAYGVRAYPEGEAYGDEGYLANIEARLLLPALSEGMPGRVQLVGFVDFGTVTFAKNRRFTGPNSAHRSGYGGGVTWAAPNNFVVKASYARKLGSAAATSAPDRSGRFWIQFAKLF